MPRWWWRLNNWCRKKKKYLKNEIERMDREEG